MKPQRVKIKSHAPPADPTGSGNEPGHCVHEARHTFDGKKTRVAGSEADNMRQFEQTRTCEPRRYGERQAGDKETHPGVGG
jgi:hypothetical protein